jgi:L-ascorbate metabolism protein UlaG (beta-lactamase superfamily)
MIGHSTVLFDGAGTRLLTDPYFSSVGHLAYARKNPPALTREEARDVDGVVVSHSHWDHTDRRFFRSLDASVPVIAPAGTSLVLRLKGVQNLVEVKPWEKRTIGAAIITAVPATHLARSLGYVVEMDGMCAYFAGDTYHRPFMKEIGRRFRIDVALMPVATFRIPPTMGESGAAATVRDLRPNTVIPIHDGIQPRSLLLRTRQTPATFARRIAAEGLDTRVVHLREGEQWEQKSEE